MKSIIIILFLVFITYNGFAFGGGNDSLLFDGAVSYELPKNADCKIKITFVETGIEVTKFTTEVLEICGENIKRDQNRKNNNDKARRNTAWF